MSTSKEEAILRDSPDPTNLLLTRLDNWVHAVSLFEDYVEIHIQFQKHTTQGLEKVRKSASDPPKFDFLSTENKNTLRAVSSPPVSTSALSPVSAPSSPVLAASPAPDAVPGAINVAAPDATTSSPAEITGPIGIAEAFENTRIRTEALINKSLETETALKNSILPQLTTIRADIEKHIKGLKTSGLKQSKDVEKAKADTQRAIEHLGQYTSSFNISSGGNRHEYKNDPYVLYRQTLNSIDDQLAKENIQIDALVFTEKSIETLERHLVQVLQQAAHLFDQILAGYHSLCLDSYHGVSETFAAVVPEAEWENFFSKNSASLVPYDKKHRAISNVTFHNDGHPSTLPIIEGTLLRKEGKLLKSWTSGYYVLTPSNYLLQYSSNNYVQDPTPDFALFLPEATVSEVSTKDAGKFKFTVQAKDGTRTVGLGSKTYSFKTNTFDEIGAWHAAIKAASTGVKQTVSHTPYTGNVVVASTSHPESAAEPVAIPPAGSSLDSPVAAAAPPTYQDPSLSTEEREAAHLAASLANTSVSK